MCLCQLIPGEDTRAKPPQQSHLLRSRASATLCPGRNVILRTCPRAPMGKMRKMVTQKSTFTITIAQKNNTRGHLPSANKAVVSRTRRVQHHGHVAIPDSTPGSAAQRDLRQVPSELRRAENLSCHSVVHLTAIFWGQGPFSLDQT